MSSLDNVYFSWFPPQINASVRLINRSEDKNDLWALLPSVNKHFCCSAVWHPELCVTFVLPVWAQADPPTSSVSPYFERRTISYRIERSACKVSAAASYLCHKLCRLIALCQRLLTTKHSANVLLCVMIQIYSYTRLKREKKGIAVLRIKRDQIVKDQKNVVIYSRFTNF